MNSAKKKLIDEVQRSIHHHETLSSADLDVRDGDGPREVVFDLVDCGKYELRDDFITNFETTVRGHRFEMVIEDFFEGHVTAVFVDMTVFSDTVQRFLDERRFSSKALSAYDSLTLTHVEALEQWGAVGRLNELEEKHIHDAFLEYHRLLDEQNAKDQLLLR